MLNLSDKLINELNSFVPHARLELPNGTVDLYSSDMGDKLLDAGFLNFVVRNASSVQGYPLTEFEVTKLTVIGQENLKKPNASYIMYVWIEEERLCAQHWDGFISYFDLKTFAFLEQKFIK
ncbi:hypothetical protein FHT82_003823 [Rhizobium sp. BK275]|uniref:hypothetical protein n=1 Tax=Rhizobium sp. BK275 TaxID=2587077 RepID=UPI001827409F|nr:hypothetical protein [Rhizobium sp. BK275]MBB3391051.1 hypothetical protein [Rhizobium sp. BK275]